ncbi:MAG: septation protein IspZ [Bacteriovoracaceae bacterium]|nr:septation protein IspZ [Bacteriovoracaceae bacterium]
MTKKTLSQKNFFLISFLPAMAYWYLEENYPIRIAITGGLILAILEIGFEHFYTKHVHTLSKFNFFLILFLGGLSLLGEDGLWFKLQPAFTGVGIAGFMIFRLWKGQGLMWEMMESMPNKPALPAFIIQGLEKHMVFLFFGYGSFMVFVALKLTTDQWLFFKTLGFYIVFGVFFLFEMVYLRVTVKKWHKSSEALNNVAP